MWYRSLLWALVVWVGLVGLSHSGPAQAQNEERCFPETGHCISGRLHQFWEQQGGLRVFGLPISPLQQETIEGETLQVQWFERHRLELHPTRNAPYDVQLGRLGVDRLEQQGQDWQSFPISTPEPDCRVFEQTGHAVCGDILALWQSYGLNLDGRVGYNEAENLALFGLPISGLQTTTLEDGKTYQVQWFERARFELHPEQRPPFQVQLGLLASELRTDAVAEQPSASTPIIRYVFPVRASQVEYGPYHHDYPATDIFCPEGSEFLATTSGVVDFVNRVDQWTPATNVPADRGGIMVAIVGDDGWRYYGSHLMGVAEGIEPGVRVAAGQLLGWTGKSGNAQSTPPHLHFGISRPTTPDDWQVRRGEIPPYEYLRAWERGEMVTPSP